MKKIKDIMNSDLLSIKATDSLGQVIDFFGKNEVSHAIVTDTVGTYKGIISKTDLVSALSSLLKATSGGTYTTLEMENHKAKDFMTANTVNLEPDQTIEYAAEILLQGKFHSLPVVQNFKTVGLVTKHDLLKGYYEQTAYSKNHNYE